MNLLFRAAAPLCLCMAFTGCTKNKEPDIVIADYNWFHPDPATAGSVTGRVTYDGPKPRPAAIDMSSDPACVKAHGGKAYDESLVAGPNGSLVNTFVYVSKGLEKYKFQVPKEPAAIDQRGCWFRPRVLGVQAGQTVNIINSDPVTHNIHPMAHVNNEWNHSQGPGDPPMHRTFSKPEIMIPVKCNIHDWMHAWIGVVDNPFFTVTKEDGSFDLSGLPPGRYTVTAWHEGLETQTASVTVPKSGRVTADLRFHAK